MSTEGPVDTTGHAESTPVTDVGPTVVVRGRKDALLDLIRAVAIVRVVLWHTWSWAWLSWIPAMPAMFFTTGALLERSLARRGWAATVAARARRLLIPYWAYAVACWSVMVVAGWRPNGVDALTWMLPLSDPVGSAAFPGLWVPLWYIRAYIWFVLGAGVLRWLHRRLGWSSVVVAAGAGVGVFWWGQTGHSVSAVLGDSGAYAPFVLAGMLYSSRRSLPRAKHLLVLAGAGAVASLLVWQRIGPADGVVNRSYLLTMTVGLVGVALVLALAVPLLRWSRPGWSMIESINSRALTIYLWQGFGLVAAQRLVGDVDRWWQPIAAVAVVAGVIAGAVAAFGWLEDVAARRPLSVPRPARLAVSAVVMAPAVAMVSAALAKPVEADEVIEAPLSGQAVVERGRLVEEDLAGTRTGVGDADAAVLPGTTAQVLLEDWVAAHRDALDVAGTEWVEVAVMTPDGELQRATWAEQGSEPVTDVAWWSMTKSVTTAWLMALVDAGVVALEDPLANWVPETPRAQDMTLEQLASHRSGVPEDLSRHIFEAHPREEIDDFIDRGRLDFEPGEGYSYSRIGYYLLALALERASGVTYADAVQAFADRAGVALRMDDEDRGPGPATDPDGHGYRGGPWSSGGLVSTIDDGARFLQWLFVEGVSEAGVDRMARFESVSDGLYYGLGLIPLCPCSDDVAVGGGGGGVVRSERVGLDTATGLFGVDRRDGATVMIATNSWWTEAEPLAEFYELQRQMLDLVGVPNG